MGRGLLEEAQDTMDASRGEVPVDTGALRDSGDVGSLNVSGSRAAVEFGYSASYAVIVHEDMNNHHDDGGPKFLEGPTLARAGGLGSRLAPDIKAVLR